MAFTTFARTPESRSLACIVAVKAFESKAAEIELIAATWDWDTTNVKLTVQEPANFLRVAPTKRRDSVATTSLTALRDTL